MDYKGDILVCTIFILSVMNLSRGSFFQGSDRILLNDLKVLTLHHGQVTTAHRSSPIPQLKCLGGSAQCSFTPQTVQCYNKGSDGYDVQWECKTDMDNAYRFGKVEVSCEGYDYPDDPYVLRGSCGLEYTLDYTKEGYQNKHRHHDYYGSNSQQYKGSNYYSSHKKHSSWFGDLITLGIVGVIIYAIYKTCLSDDHNPNGRASAGGYDPYRGSGSNPPPPGFRSEYMPDDGCSTGYSSGYGGTYARPRNNWFGNGFGGFWGGAATGGMLGYLLGNRNTGYGYGYGNRAYNRGWGYGGNSWGSGSSWGSGPSMGSSFSSSSGTRTASGFGGTKRR